MTDEIVIPSRCSKCNAAVTLHFVWAGSIDPKTPATWVCPHCNRQHEIRAIGRVVKVATGGPSG